MAVQVERPWEFTAKSLDFGLDLWKLHTMPGRRLQFLYLNGYYFQPISLDSQQKVGHSIPRPLDLHGHRVKRPLFMSQPPVGPLPSFGHLIIKYKVETPYHDNDLILTPIISPQSGW
jgi:hypothetical protein